MKLILTTLLLFGAFKANAQGKVIEGMYGANTQMTTNYVMNRGCFINTRNITASGGSLTRNTTTPLENGADCQIDANATAQTYSWATYTFDRRLSGQNCEARFVYRGDASLYRAYVQVGGVKVTTDLQLTNSQSPSVQPVSINFPCGAQPLTTSVVIESTSASAAAINVAGVYAGLATNLSNVSQASFYGGAEQTAAGTCSYIQTTSSGLNNYVTLGSGSGCSAWSVAGAVSVVGTNDHRIVLQNLPVGEYQIQLQGYPNKGTSSAGQCFFRLTDGTNNYQPQAVTSNAAAYVGVPVFNFHVSRTSPASSVTYSIQASDDYAGSCGLENSISGLGLSWKIYRFPSASELVQRNSTIYFPSYSATITAGATCTLATDVVQNGNWITGCTRNGAADFTLTFATGTFVAAPHCSVTPRRALANTRYTISSWIETVTNTSARVQWAGNDDQQASILAAIAVTDDSGSFHITCTAREAASLPTPVLVGSVTSNSTGALRMEYAEINSGCTSVTAQSGSWVTSVSDGGTAGQCTLTIPSGIFSAAPTCSITCKQTSGNPRIGWMSPGTDSTTSQAGFCATTAGTLTATGMEFICTGPR